MKFEQGSGEQAERRRPGAGRRRRGDEIGVEEEEQGVGVRPQGEVRRQKALENEA